MVEHQAHGQPRLEHANIFRHSLFQCFFEIDPSVRADALKTISHAVDFWTLSWLEFHDRTPFSSGARGARPPIASHSSVSSAISSTPGTQLRRDSSFMQFDDVFGGDGDESPSMRRKDSTPYSPDRDDVSGWASMVRECATYTSEESNSYFDQETTFSNKGIGAIETGVEDVNWAGRLVAREIWGVEEMRVNLENYYCWLLRFSVDCPFLNVRRGCKEILARAERSGAQLPVIPSTGPSMFIPLSETVGLDYPEQAWTPVTPSGKSHSPLDTPSEEEDEAVHSPRGAFPIGIMIPESKGTIYGDRQRSRSRGRLSIGSSIGRSTRWAALASAIFQTPPSPSNLASSHKIKRRPAGRRPVTKFLPKAKEPSEDVRNLQMQTYWKTGRVNNFNKLLFLFPRFAKTCREVTDLFLSDDAMDGPLPQTWRIYLGILAAAEKRCQYYISLLSEKFLTIQGPVEWLKGIAFCPPKLQRIAHLNKSLAHLPWTVTADDISWLVRVDDALKLRWSVSEVIQGILILSFYHGKSALALAWGILPEADLLGGTVKTSTPVAPFGSFAPSVSLSTGPPSDLSASLRGISSLERLGMKGTPSTKFFFPTRKRESPLHDSVPEKWRKTPAGEIPLSSTPVSPTDATTPADHPRPKRRQSFDECGTTDEPFPLFDHAALSSSAPHTNSPFASIKPPGSSMLKESYVLSPSSSTTTSSSTFDPNPFLLAEQSPINIMLDDYARFVCPSSLSLPLSDPNRNTYEFLPMEDFDFCNATCIIDSYLESLVGLLDDYIKEAMDAEMDDDNLFNSTVVSADDTSVKEAVWYFSLRQMNIQKDDFRYSDVKYLLSKQTRRYLKRICVQPEMVSAADWIGLTGMKTEEKCRLGLLACQARFLGEVLWGIRGVSEFLC